MEHWAVKLMVTLDIPKAHFTERKSALMGGDRWSTIDQEQREFVISLTLSKAPEPGSVLKKSYLLCIRKHSTRGRPRQLLESLDLSTLLNGLINPKQPHSSKYRVTFPKHPMGSSVLLVPLTKHSTITPPFYHRKR